MNKFQCVCFAGCFALTGTTVQAAEYVAADENPISQLCISAAVDSPLRFLDTMRGIRVSKGVVANKITCNGIDIIDFAKNAGNEGNYRHLSHYRRGHVEISDLAQMTYRPQQLKTVTGQVSEVARP